MENKILLTMHSDQGELTKEIFELAEENLREYKILGKGLGINMSHCLQLANKHCNGFLNRVVRYRVVKDDEQAKMLASVTKKEYIAVEFYEKIVQTTEHNQRWINKT